MNQKSLLTVKGMTCNGCVSSVRNVLSIIPGVAKIEVDLKTGLVSVDHDQQTTIKVLQSAIEEAGYDVEKSETQS